jgi:hypothetical protein
MKHLNGAGAAVRMPVYLLALKRLLFPLQRRLRQAQHSLAPLPFALPPPVRLFCRAFRVCLFRGRPLCIFFLPTTAAQRFPRAAHAAHSSARAPRTTTCALPSPLRAADLAATVCLFVLVLRRTRTRRRFCRGSILPRTSITNRSDVRWRVAAITSGRSWMCLRVRPHALLRRLHMPSHQPAFCCAAFGCNASCTMAQTLPRRTKTSAGMRVFFMPPGLFLHCGRLNLRDLPTRVVRQADCFLYLCLLANRRVSPCYQKRDPAACLCALQ